MSDRRPLPFSVTGSTVPVSYTHLDVYKRQIHGMNFSNEENSSTMVCTHTQPVMGITA